MAVTGSGMNKSGAIFEGDVIGFEDLAGAILNKGVLVFQATEVLAKALAEHFNIFSADDFFDLFQHVLGNNGD